MNVTPIDYIEHRLAELRSEQPETESGRKALQVAIAELELILTTWKVDALTALMGAIEDAYQGESRIH